MRKILVITLALAMFASIALADGTFSFGGVLENMDLLDAHRSTTNEVLNPSILICEPLLALKEDGSIVPQLLAEIPEMNEDGTVFTCKLRDDVYFHDGTKLTSEDVYFTLRRIFDPATQCLNSWLCDMIKGGNAMLNGEATELEGVKIIDDLTFTIELEYPYAPFNYILSCPQMVIFPKAACEAAGEYWGIDAYVGTGPFVLEEFSPKDVLHVVANENYYEGRPSLDEVYYYNMDPNTALMEYEAGTLDMVSVQPDYIGGYTGEDFADQLIKVELQGVIALNLNVSIAPLDDVRVRRAVALAVNQQGIVDGYLQGNGSATNTMVPPGIAAHSDRPITFDPDAAKALLAEAGYPDGITLVNYVSEEASIAHIPVVLQEQLKASGINLEVNRVDAATYTSMRKEGSVQCPILTWYADMPDPDNFLYTFYHSANSKLWSSLWNDERTDKDLVAARSMANGPERTALYEQLEEYLIVDQAVTVPLYNPVTFYLKSPAVTGIFFDNSMFHMDDAVKN